jgi:small-conductance mechanosensitive channel
MEEPTARKLRFVALQVVGAVAVVHLVAGLAELVRFANAGLLGAYLTGEQLLSQPEPVLFTVSAVAILAGVLAVGLGYLDYRRAYALGIAILSIYLLSWLAWHSFLDHGLLGGSEQAAADHTHEGLVSILASHYVEPMVGIFTGADQPGQVTLAVVSKTLETVALVLLAVLYVADPRVEDPENPVVAMGGETGEN